ncbi:helix-turn-helix domain-containing protein [Mycolicibacterium sp. NCC-Tsukiji]|uniref:helix-turn-helix domain-containing protein n=1 Tax=Mycolicibacterium sp. NCC-Tsukiji TaxID=2185272 RepID=UPI0035B54C27
MMARLNVGRSTVYGLLASGELRSCKIGQRRLVSESALVEYLSCLLRERSVRSRRACSPVSRTPRSNAFVTLLRGRCGLARRWIHCPEDWSRGRPAVVLDFHAVRGTAPAVAGCLDPVWPVNPRNVCLQPG